MYHLAVPENAPEFGLQCWIDFGAAWHWKLYMSLVATSLFFIPAVIIASCYAVIVITIWRKGKTMAAPRVTQSLLPRGEYFIERGLGVRMVPVTALTYKHSPLSNIKQTQC